MAIRVYRLAVVGCPRRVIEKVSEGRPCGVGKSCLCNRFVKPEAYTEEHDSLVSARKWEEDPAISGDHFLYWGATTRHLQDGSKARFQVVEQTEFYDKEAASAEGGELEPHPCESGYLERASCVRVATSSVGKVAVRLKAEQASARAGGIRSTTQIFPNEDFAGKNGGVLGFACVFDPTLSGERMERQIAYLTQLLQGLSKRKKKIVIVCTKCDEASEEQIKLGASLAAGALKKAIPFFEVSSRDDINVEDPFFTLIGQARKSPKLPRTPKSPKNSRHFSIGGHVSYKDAVSLRKRDVHRAKDAYRRLLQKKITSFSAVWSEAYLELESEEEFSNLLELAGKEGKDIVKNMFCLRLIEIKLTEGAKLYGVSSATKKLDKGKSQEYQQYLSDALKSHPDLRDESSVYDYVYSTGVVDATSLHSHQTSVSSDNTSGTFSNCDTPENPLPSVGSAPDLTRRGRNHTNSMIMPELSEKRDMAVTSHSVDILSAQSPLPASPLSQARHSSVHAAGSSPQILDSDTDGGGVVEKNAVVSRSQPLLDVTPPPPPTLVAARLALDRRRSNSMGRLETSPRLSAHPSSESVDVLNAEPYLQPMEIQMVMHTLPRSQKIPESTSYHSIHGGEGQRPKRQQPLRVSAVDISESYQASVAEARKLGHRRVASNPWVLESGGGEHQVVGSPLPLLPPPVPARDYQRPSKSPPLLSARVLDPNESSLDFSTENRRSVVSASLSPKLSSAVDLPQPQYADIDEIDNVSTVSGPFEEISDDPDSTSEGDKKPEKKAEKPWASPSRLMKKKSSTLNTDYEKIEEYITMAPTTTFPRRSFVSPEQPSPKPAASAERTPKKSVAAPPPKTKKGWSRQSTDSVIPDAATIRSTSPPLFPTRRFTMLDTTTSPHRTTTSASNIRPLPPSPTKPVTSPTKRVGVSRNNSSASNIYETIDEELLNRVRPRRRGSGLPKWAPPVEPKHYAQYLVILRKFFTDPKIIEAWERTVQEIIPGGDISKYPPPYSNLQTKQTRRLGPMIEVPSPQRAGSAEPSSSSTPKHENHARQSSHDQYVLPTSLIQPQSHVQPSSMPATPAITRPAGPPERGGFSSPRQLFAAKRPASRENLIEMLNMSMFNQADSSESESDESSEEESEEEEEIEDEEEEDEGGVDGEGEGVRGEEREGGSEESEESATVDLEGAEEMTERLQTSESEEEPELTDAASREPVSETGHGSITHAASDKEYDEVEDDLDSILTKLNPILQTFGSVTDDTIDLTPHHTTAQPKSDSQMHTPPDPIHMEHDPVLRASVSTDSDIDSASSLVKPSALFQKRAPPSGSSRVMKWVNSFEQETQETGPTGRKREPLPVPKRKPARAREVVMDGMSDSGISNCHSQTYDDGFNPLETS